MFKTKKRWLFPVLGILLASLTAHAEDVGSFKHFLVGGDPVPQGKLEAVGRLPGCTATLIGPQTVLTAAHCVCAGQTTPTGCDTQQSFTLVNVRPVDDPTTATDESATRRDITMRGSVRIHPSYTSDGWLSHDFAIVDLNQPASDLDVHFVNPMPVHSGLDKV